MGRQASRYRQWCQCLGDGGSKDDRDVEGDIKKQRQRYYHLKRDLTIAPDGSYPTEMQDDNIDIASSSSRQRKSTAPPLEVNNPLSLSEKNPWHTYLASLSMLDQIKVDVERAFPDDERFRSNLAQSQMTRILFVWSLMETNAHVGYRQGIHEIAAVCWLVRKDEENEDEIEADAFHLLELIMQRVRSWYEWRNLVKLPISSKCEDIHTLLLATDANLATHLATIGVEIQLFAIRWIRLLFTREMPLEMSLDLWDSLFKADASLILIDSICVAMMIRIRTQLLDADYSSALQALLNYPDYALQAPADTLIEQAQMIRDSSNRETLMTLMQANEEMLVIPTNTQQSYDYTPLPTPYGLPFASSVPPSLSHLTKNLSAQTLSAGFGRALYNVQRSVNAAYSGHSGGNITNGFPPSFESPARSYSVGAGKENAAELERLKETNRQMGNSMIRVIESLEKHWVDNVASNDQDAEASAKGEEEFLLCLTTLKHSRDVLLGSASEFDSTIMDGPKKELPKKETKLRNFGDRFPRSIDSASTPIVTSQSGPVRQTSKSMDYPDQASKVTYPVRKIKTPPSNSTTITSGSRPRMSTKSTVNDPLGAS